MRELKVPPLSKANGSCSEDDRDRESQSQPSLSSLSLLSLFSPPSGMTCASQTSYDTGGRLVGR